MCYFLLSLRFTVEVGKANLTFLSFNWNLGSFVCHKQWIHFSLHLLCPLFVLPLFHYNFAKLCLKKYPTSGTKNPTLRFIHIIMHWIMIEWQETEYFITLCYWKNWCWILSGRGMDYTQGSVRHMWYSSWWIRAYK